MALELWGGHEATVNRVGDRFFDQTIRSGHHERLSDLEAFAALGVKALRYPVLWERVAPHMPESRDFSWSDARLAELRRLGIKPIVGLVHHGSGPAYTNLLDEGFAAGLAGHARAVAERYPWVSDWTPVNEPLTTARFSCLYGIWYPHGRDERQCWIALLNQIDAIRFAMREIRQVNPGARLIQTEDLGYCHATAALTHQAAFENARRWLTWDLLTGRVVPGHELWPRLKGHGLEPRLAAIAADPCPPGIIGVNHYLSSERFLDHRLDLYRGLPPAVDGPVPFNTVPFVNVEAVRALETGPLGLPHLLEDAWARYRIPLAVTECHNGCTRDEQLRWFAETWNGAEDLRRDGIPVQAVTAWSLLGCYDWNHLVTKDAGHYEAGVFDVRTGRPRATALAHLLTGLSGGTPARTLSITSPGWWRREDRFLYPRPDAVAEAPLRRRRPPAFTQDRPIVIAGRTGTLGQALARACARRGLAHIVTDRSLLPLEDPAAIRDTLRNLDAAAVINAAGWVRIDDAEEHPEECMAVNGIGPENMARACSERDIPFVTFSSDQVFDGVKGELYVEGDRTNPLNIYGTSKAEAERRVLALGSQALIVRTAAFFSPNDPHNFAFALMQALRAGREFSAARDQFVSPTYVPDLVDAVLDLLIDGETGIWHLTNAGRVSWAQFAGLVAQRARLDRKSIKRVPGAALGMRAPRPADVALHSGRGQVLPPLEDAISRFVDGCWKSPHFRGDGTEFNALMS